MPSLKTNAFYSVAYQVIRLIFPIVTYPYVSRIIGPEGIGKVSYAQTLANYVSVVALLGLPMYASREISRSRAKEGALNKAYSELITLSFLLSLAGFVVYASLPALFPAVTAGRTLHWLFALAVATNFAKLDWFFQGIENYRYVTIRNLVVRIATVALIFSVITQPDHFVRYGMLWVGGTVIGNLWNLAYSLRFAAVSIRGIRPFRHVKALLPSAGLALTATLYDSLDTLMLGTLVNDDRYSVGIYSVAARLIRIGVSIVAAGNAAIGPRITLQHELGDKRGMNRIIQKSFWITLFFGVPAVIGIFLLADDLVLLFAGRQFVDSITTLRIKAPELLLLGLTTILAGQIMYARRRDKALLKVTISVLVVAIGLNMLLIPTLRQDGAAIGTLLSRIIEMSILTIIGWSAVKDFVLHRETVKILLLNMIWGGLLFVSLGLAEDFSIPIRMTVLVLGGAFVYGLMSLALRLQVARQILGWFWKTKRA